MTKKPYQHEIPQPVPIGKRTEPLPWQIPKAPEDDPEAARRIEALIKSPSYKRADLDVDFLGLSESRGARLALDYQKPELYLRRYGVENTIVVFGSTRICEPAAADRHVAQLAAELQAHPGQQGAQKKTRRGQTDPGKIALLRSRP